MTKKLFILKGVADFAPGAFENTAVEEDSIQLGRSGTGYFSSGSYASLPFSPGAFFSMIPSWNADVPEGTYIEVEVRVSVSGRWGSWFTLGRWSPFINRASAEKQSDDMACLDRFTLSLAEGQPPAEMAQIRVLLFSDQPNLTPMVRMLAVSTNAAQKAGDEGACCNRVLEFQEYSCLVRDPGISGRIASATSLTMMVNHFGEDVLPEEVARAAYDVGAGYFGNLSFLCAVAGMYGYECYVQYAGVDALRREVWRRHAVGARVHYRAPSLGGEETPPGEEGMEQQVPVLEGATVDSSGHVVVVRGFVSEGDEEFVEVHDPMASSDGAVRRKIPLAVFQQIYNGICLVLYPGEKGAGAAKPRRVVTQMEVRGDEILLSKQGEILKPGQTIPGDISRATICYTLSDGVAYASAAQRKFYYLAPDKKGRLKFDRVAAAGRKLTMYIIGSRGTTWVAEKMVEPLPGADVVPE